MFGLKLVFLNSHSHTWVFSRIKRKFERVIQLSVSAEKFHLLERLCEIIPQARRFCFAHVTPQLGKTQVHRLYPNCGGDGCVFRR